MSFGAREEYRVLLEGGREMAAEPSGALRAFDGLPSVGDWVRVRLTPDLCLIEEVEARRTAFIRKAAGRVHASQCVAANIDVCFVVCGLDGNFNLRRIERYLVLAWESGARPVVVLNKEDICVDVATSVNAVRATAGSAAVGRDQRAPVDRAVARGGYRWTRQRRYLAHPVQASPRSRMP